jgi:alpha-beta hydrolase superfamily lysophospholipase
VAGAPRASEAVVAGVGGVAILHREWPADGEPRAVVVIAHGAGEHSGRYAHVAARLAAAHCAVYALDHRGHGSSGGPRALIDRMAHAVVDLDALVVEAAGRHPGLPIVLVGHSMGGTVAVAYACAHGERLSGLVLSGPLAAIEAAPVPLRVLSRALSAAVPRLPLIAVDPALVSRDPVVVEAYVKDPLNHHGRLPARTVAELAGTIERFPAEVGAITVPTLIMYGTADALCPPAGSVMLGERVGSADRTIKAYDGLFHEIFNEPERDAVLDDVCAWLSARAGTPEPDAAGSSRS